MGEHRRRVVVHRVDDVRQRQRRRGRQCGDLLEIRGAEDDRMVRRIGPDGRGEPRALALPHRAVDRGLVQDLEEQAIGRAIARDRRASSRHSASISTKRALRLGRVQAAQSLARMQVEADRQSRSPTGVSMRGIELGPLARHLGGGC